MTKNTFLAITGRCIRFHRQHQKVEAHEIADMLGLSDKRYEALEHGELAVNFGDLFEIAHRLELRFTEFSAFVNRAYCAVLAEGHNSYNVRTMSDETFERALMRHSVYPLLRETFMRNPW
jgi:transcriptional regulator with XRE-family HTH domain